MLKKSFIVLFIFVNSSYALTLKEGFLKSLGNDSEVQLRENELKKIKYDIDMANGLKYPTLDIVGAVNNTRTSQKSYTPQNSADIQADEYSLRLTQPLYDGFQSDYEKELQKTRYESAQYYLKEAQNNLALTFVENYINVLKTKDMINLSTESYQMSKDIYTKTTKKVERGFGTKLEFERAKGNIEESSVNLAIDKLSFSNAIKTLYKNLQEEIDSSEIVKPTFNYNLPSSEEEALNFALANHPSMLVSQKNVKVAMNEQQRELKAFYPDINLVGNYKLNDAAYKENGIDVSNEYQVGLELALNLYNGGRDFANNKKLLQMVKEKKILVEKSNQEISNRLGLAWNSYTLNQEKLLRLEAFLKTRKLVLDTTFQEFYLGTKDLGSVVDAHLNYISTKRSTISTTYDLLLAHFQVLEAIGILSDQILSDKKEEIWGYNEKKIDIDKIVKNNTEGLVYSYKTSQDEEMNKKEEIKFEYLNNEPAKEKTPAKETFVSNNNSSFKDTFLNSPQDKYTINLATFVTAQESENFINLNKINNNAFAFLFGENKQYYKVMYGVFNNLDEAKNALEKLDIKLKKNQPRVEEIYIKQNLYKKYNQK